MSEQSRARTGAGISRTVRDAYFAACPAVTLLALHHHHPMPVQSIMAAHAHPHPLHTHAHSLSVPPSPPQTPYSCDTLPAPQNLRLTRSLSPAPPPGIDDAASATTEFNVPTIEEVRAKSATPDRMDEGQDAVAAPPQPPARKLCVRHQRMADEGTNLKLQQSLDALPVHEREAINAIWSNFSSSSHARRALILQGLLTMCCFSQISFLTEQLEHLIRIDPLAILPREVSLQIFGHLDAISLCRAAQVSRTWKNTADDDILWRNICEQHIGTKCLKCGWGLPVLERRRGPCAQSPTPSTGASSTSGHKRELEEEDAYLSLDERPLKRAKSEVSQMSDLQISAHSSLVPSSSNLTPSSAAAFFEQPIVSAPQPITATRPWKDIYSERLGIERNWRRGRCTVRAFKGHTDGVMCMQFSETLKHPSFPVLITGSYDRTIRVWNMETGHEVRQLRGHTRAIRALQFDEVKLVTASMDRTIKVWNWRTGACIRTLEGHTDGVVAVNFDDSILASGSADNTVRVWNFRTGQCFTLRGHRDWVNSVQLWDSNAGSPGSPAPDSAMSTSASSASASSGVDVDPGKMLFSASDDGTIRLWDLNMRSCVRIYQGHVGQVQTIKLVTVDDEADDNATHPEPSSSENYAMGTLTTATPSPVASPPPRDPNSPLPSGLPSFAPASVSVPMGMPPGHPGLNSPAAAAPPGFDPHAYRTSPHSPVVTRSFVHPNDASTSTLTPSSTIPATRRSASPASRSKGKKTVLLSGSLDNTIKVWDIATAEPVRTLFGHIEGVWAIESDKFRVVSASHDRTIKVWTWEDARCMATLVGHCGAVTCLALGDDKIVSGSDDGDVRIWSFTP